MQRTLQLAQQLLVSSWGDGVFLQPACARLANAMVAVMGPEFTVGSPDYQRCKSLLSGSSGAAAGTATANCNAMVEHVRLVETTWSELEQVLYAQQLVLFVPTAVPAQQHAALLQVSGFYEALLEPLPRFNAFLFQDFYMGFTAPVSTSSQ